MTQVQCLIFLAPAFQTGNDNLTIPVPTDYATVVAKANFARDVIAAEVKRLYPASAVASVTATLPSGVPVSISITPDWT